MVPLPCARLFAHGKRFGTRQTHGFPVVRSSLIIPGTHPIPLLLFFTFKDAAYTSTLLFSSLYYKLNVRESYELLLEDENILRKNGCFSLWALLDH